MNNKQVDYDLIAALLSACQDLLWHMPEGEEKQTSAWAEKARVTIARATTRVKPKEWATSKSRRAMRKRKAAVEGKA